MYNVKQIQNKEVRNMPTLKHLLDELRKLAVDPDDVRLPGQLYDDLVEQAEDTTEENPEEE